MTRVGDEVGFVFPGNILAVGRFVGLFGGSDVFGFPGFAAVERTADVNSIPAAVMTPVAVGSKLVESDVADKSVALIVVGCGNVSGNAIAGGLDAGGDLPGAACVKGVRSVRVVLINRDNLLRIIGIDGDAGFGEITGLRSERNHCRVWSFRRELSESVRRNSGERRDQDCRTNRLS